MFISLPNEIIINTDKIIRITTIHERNQGNSETTVYYTFTIFLVDESIDVTYLFNDHIKAYYNSGKQPYLIEEVKREMKEKLLITRKQLSKMLSVCTINI